MKDKDPITIILRKVANKSMGVSEAKVIIDNFKQPDTYRWYPQTTPWTEVFPPFKTTT